MSTITPNSDTTTIVDRTSPNMGDIVARLSDGVIGTILQTNFEGVPTQVFVGWYDSTYSAADVLDLRKV